MAHPNSTPTPNTSQPDKGDARQRIDPSVFLGGALALPPASVVFEHLASRAIEPSEICTPSDTPWLNVVGMTVVAVILLAIAGQPRELARLFPWSKTLPNTRLWIAGPLTFTGSIFLTVAGETALDHYCPTLHMSFWDWRTTEQVIMGVAVLVLVLLSGLVSDLIGYMKGQKDRRH